MNYIKYLQGEVFQNFRWLFDGGFSLVKIFDLKTFQGQIFLNGEGYLDISMSLVQGPITGEILNL